MSDVHLRHRRRKLIAGHHDHVGFSAPSLALRLGALRLQHPRFWPAWLGSHLCIAGPRARTEWYLLALRCACPRTRLSLVRHLALGIGAAVYAALGVCSAQ